MYLKKIAAGDRPAKDFDKTKQDVLEYLKTSPDAAKSRQQLRNAVGSKEYVKLIVVDKYKCSVCGYIYDPEIGDPDNGVSPGTSFEQLSDLWACPECGANKDSFEKLE